MASLNPNVIATSPSSASSKFEKLLGKLLTSRWMDASDCDKAKQQYIKFQDQVNKYHKETCSMFKTSEQRLDEFWAKILDGKEQYDVLWSVVKKILTLSHGQACIERGFSVNKEVSDVNMDKETIIAYRVVYDAIKSTLAKRCMSFQLEKLFCSPVDKQEAATPNIWKMQRRQRMHQINKIKRGF